MRLQDYEPIVGRSTLEELRFLASRLSGRTILNINSTATGGGVAEILQRMLPLMQQLGVDARWSVIRGDEAFFRVTKKFHNALHGKEESISPEELEVYLAANRKNMEALDLSADIVFIHDPQPAALVLKRGGGNQWVWRCHIDVSCPDPKVWEFLRQFVLSYDAAVFSAPNFAQQLPIRQFLVSPSIDPLSIKNKELPETTVTGILEKFGIDPERPVITQISRFDHLKDPLGVIEAFRMVRKAMDCQLVLAGGPADDDPEAVDVLQGVKEQAEGNRDIHILTLPPGSDTEINALQQGSTIILQKSLKEGFGLTVTEALWKAKPVVATAVGGIPLQVRHRLTGLLVHGVEGTAFALRQLLANPDYARWLGENGREHVRHNFLITRHLKDYLLLFLALGRAGEVIYL